jgi:hypothetical protein
MVLPTIFKYLSKTILFKNKIFYNNSLPANILISLTIIFYLRIHKEKMHLKKCEEGLEDRVRYNDILNAIVFHRCVHRNFESNKDQSSQTKN